MVILVNLRCSARLIEIGEIAGLHRGVADGGCRRSGPSLRAPARRLRRASGQRAQKRIQLRQRASQSKRRKWLRPAVDGTWKYHVLLLSLKRFPAGAAVLARYRHHADCYAPFNRCTNWPAPSTSSWTWATAVTAILDRRDSRTQYRHSRELPDDADLIREHLDRFLAEHGQEGALLTTPTANNSLSTSPVTPISFSLTSTCRASTALTPPDACASGALTRRCAS